ACPGGPLKLILFSSSGGACLNCPRIVPATTFVSIWLALATAGISAVKGTKLTFAPLSFPEEPVRVKKLIAAWGSVFASVRTALTVRPGSLRSIKAWQLMQCCWYSAAPLRAAPRSIAGKPAGHCGDHRVVTRSSNSPRALMLTDEE